MVAAEEIQLSFVAILLNSDGYFPSFLSLCWERALKSDFSSRFRNGLFDLTLAFQACLSVLDTLVD